MGVTYFSYELQRELGLSLFFRSLLVLVRANKKKRDFLFAQILFLIKKKVPAEAPLDVLILALVLVTPMVGLRPKKVAGSVYRIPFLLTQKKAAIQAVKFITKASLLRVDGTNLAEKLANELVDCFSSVGGAFNEKSKLYEEVERNRVFLKYLR